MQSHKCAYLDSCGYECRGSDEHCQYKLTGCCSLCPTICGKDQIVELIRKGVL